MAQGDPPQPAWQAAFLEWDQAEQGEPGHPTPPVGLDPDRSPPDRRGLYKLSPL